MTAYAKPLEHELVSNPRHYRYYDLVMAGFVTVLLCSNLIGPGKTCILFGLTFGTIATFTLSLGATNPGPPRT